MSNPWDESEVEKIPVVSERQSRKLMKCSQCGVKKPTLFASIRKKYQKT